MINIKHTLFGVIGLFALSLSGPGNAQSFTFQQDVAGYTGTVTVQVNDGAPDTSILSSDSTEDRLSVDLENEEFADLETQVLIRFDDIVGGSAIPSGSSVAGATLRVFTKSSSVGPVSVGPSDQPFTTSSTWNSLLSGAAVLFTEDTATNITDEAFVDFNVTAGVQAIVDGDPNNGWVFLNASDDGWDFCSELPTCAFSAISNDLKPRLTVVLGGSSTPVPTIGFWGLVLLTGLVPLFAARRLKQAKES